MPAPKKRKIEYVQDSSLIDLTALDDSHSELSDDDIQFIGTSTNPTTTLKARSPAKGKDSAIKSINQVLKDKKFASISGTASIPKPLPPLELTTGAQIAEHTPCTFHPNFLPQSLAERLYKAMLAESPTWTKNKWYLNDKQVESPHTTCFYSSDDKQNATHWYLGRKAGVNEDEDKPRVFLEEMHEARQLVEEFVNEELRTRKRFPLEFDGPWQGNVAAANCYRGRTESVGAHADQLTYLGPYTTIASISLGTTRNFRLRAVPSVQEPNAPPPRTYDIRLPHNSLTIMWGGCQERFKHAITPARSMDLFKLKDSSGNVETFIERINITFRFYRPDFSPSSTPICRCGVPCVLRADAKGKAAANIQESSDSTMRFFWQCFAGAQNEGKRCNYFKILDMEGEKRGPCLKV